MDQLLRMRLFGYPEIRLGATPLSFRRRKSVALLAYLALTGRPAARETLAALLADETSEQLALQSLRASIAELREQLDGYLLLSRQSVAFNSAAPHWIDVQEFQRRVGATADAGGAPPQGDELYAGDLLEGFVLRGAPGFGAWLAAERQQLRDLALRAWHEQLDAHAAAGDLRAALAVADRLLAASPIAEQTYRKAMALLAASGERERAMQLYARCRAALAEHLGVTPLHETTALYERIRDGSFVAPTPAAAPPSRDAATPPPSDLALLAERLADPECRLVTLLAPSPMTATALALRVVARFLALGQAPGAHPFPDGVYVTAPGGEPHAPAAPRPGLAQLIWQALAEGGDGALSADGSLLERLSSRALLLVLDGLTPTDDEVALVAAILQRAPRVTLLAASRERLYLQEEWVLDVGKKVQAGG
jgi:DNA-binding SARP family transcriptional activator